MGKSVLLLLLVFAFYCTDLSLGHASCGCGAHDHDHDYDGVDHPHPHDEVVLKAKIPEELAEDEEMELYGFGHHHHHHHEEEEIETNLSGYGLWMSAMGCSLLVSLASLVCLILLPFIFIHGKPSKAFVDSLALFGAGAMLGDAFLHQLPHAFGGEHSHSHDHHEEHSHSNEHSHSHSLKDLSVGLSILAGIVLFLLVEKLVRYIEHNSAGGTSWGHGHHHHHHKSSQKLKDDADSHDKRQSESSDEPDKVVNADSNIENSTQHEFALRKRKPIADGNSGKQEMVAVDGSTTSIEPVNKKELDSFPLSLVFGYLNLFSDGVHNFTDGMALGSAFLLYGSVGGWSRTLFLLAHELPQEIGDFGILVRSGFSVTEALFFNFLSALVALAGTALALIWGQDPGQSSLIEGFTAGGFIYIAVAGVLAEMNNGSTSVKTTAVHVSSLVSGMAVALFISLIE